MRIRAVSAGEPFFATCHDFVRRCVGALEPDAVFAPAACGALAVCQFSAVGEDDAPRVDDPLVLPPEAEDGSSVAF